MRTQKWKKYLPHLPRFSFTCNSSTSFLPLVGVGVAVSLYHLSLLLLPTYASHLLQHGSFLWAPVLQELFRHRSVLHFLAEDSHQCMFLSRVTAPGGSLPQWVFHGLQPPSGCIHLLWRGVCHKLQEGWLLSCGLPQAAGGQPAPPWSFPQAAGQPLLWYLELLLPFTPWPWWAV